MNHKRVGGRESERDREPSVEPCGREATERLETREVPVSDTSRPLETTRLQVAAPATGAGLVLDRYRLDRAIGVGGHGSVWRAFDEKLRRSVAVKVVPRASLSGDRRAEREAQAAARLNHPAIVSLYELGHDDRATYLVSELVEGRTLADLEAEGAASDRDLAQIGLALCSALAHAHRRGVIHRDVKPQNVLVADEPAAGAGFAKLADFGIARLLAEEPLTVTGSVVGTLAYMAPEQAAGANAAEPADVYSLALTLHEGFAGIRPAGPSRRPRPLRAVRRDLPAVLTAVVDECLDDRPESRPALAELRRALEDALDELSGVGGIVAPGPLERAGISLPSRRRPNVPGLPDTRRPMRLPHRVLAALAAAASVLTLTSVLGAGAALGITPAVLAGAACLIVPRVGWAMSAAGLCGWLVTTGRPGIALLVAIPALATPLLLPRAGVLWSAPALAPALGFAGLAPAFPALAGLAGGFWRRAGLAVAGLVWLLAAEALSGVTLLQGPAADTASAETFAGSAVSAARDAVYPTLTAGLVASAAVWVALSALAPLVARVPRGAPRLAVALLWAAAQVIAGSAIADALGLASAVGQVAGAALGAVVLVAASSLREARVPGRREGFQAPSVP